MQIKCAPSFARKLGNSTHCHIFFAMFCKKLASGIYYLCACIGHEVK